MQAVIQTKQDGSVVIEFDNEAAQAMVASIVFASRFHERIVPLAGMVEASLQHGTDHTARSSLCQ